MWGIANGLGVDLAVGLRTPVRNGEAITLQPVTATNTALRTASVFHRSGNQLAVTSGQDSWGPSFESMQQRTFASPLPITDFAAIPQLTNWPTSQLANWPTSGAAR